jgi:predicted branched-subunit amino acid permease
VAAVTARGAFLQGVRESVPLQLGLAPFGAVTGVAAVEAGLSPPGAVGMSVVVFAGAAQLAAIELLGETAPLAVIVGTAAIINARMVMYSASIAPYFSEYRRRVRAVAAYFLVDQAYAMSVTEFTEGGRDRHRVRYYLGIGIATWLVWVAATAAGAAAGASVPPEFELSFAVPLVFLSLLVPAMKDRPTVAAAVAAGTVATAASGAPFNLALPIGAVVGICTGLAVEAWGNR